MLNCGATIDLAANLALTPALKCLVLDSHKPIHINNVHGSDQVLVVKDSSVSEENVPSELSESEEEERKEVRSGTVTVSMGDSNEDRCIQYSPYGSTIRTSRHDRHTRAL